MGSAIAAIIAAVIGGTTAAISGGVNAKNTRLAGEEAKRIALMNYEEQKKQERIATQEKRDADAYTTKMNEIKMSIERKQAARQQLVEQANAALQMLNNRNQLRSNLSTLQWGGR
jgi:hypothetical protein